MTAPPPATTCPFEVGSPHSPSPASGSLNSSRPERVGDLPEVTGRQPVAEDSGKWSGPPRAVPVPLSRPESRAPGPVSVPGPRWGRSGRGHLLTLRALKRLHLAGEADPGKGKDNREARTDRGCHRPLTEASRDAASWGSSGRTLRVEVLLAPRPGGLSLRCFQRTEAGVGAGLQALGCRPGSLGAAPS